MPRPMHCLSCLASIVMLVAVAFCSLTVNAGPPIAPFVGEEQVEEAATFGLEWGFPWIEIVQPVPAFDTRGGTRELLRVELTLALGGYSESRFTPYQSDASAGTFLTRVFADVTAVASSDSGDYVADPAWSAEGFVRSPDLMEGEQSAWLPAMFAQASTQSVSGDLSMWLDPDGIVDLTVFSAGGNWVQAAQAANLQVDDTDIELTMTVAYVWRTATGSAAPAPAVRLPDRERVLTRFVHHVNRQRAGGVYLVNGTEVFGP